jgi:hypothetical protein
MGETMAKQDRKRWRTGTGGDELSLAEFPIGILNSRPTETDPLTARFTTGDKEWLVSANPRYGLPTDGDRDLYLVLMEVARAEGYPGKVTFERRSLLERLAWNPGTRGYERLKLGLDRLTTVSIHATNAFYDPERKAYYPHVVFHILDAYGVGEESIGRRGATWWFRWGPEFLQSLRSGRWKGLDLDQYFGLGSAISRGLYRFLDLRGLDGKREYEIGLRQLAHEHLGLSRSYYPSDLKRKLAPAHEELRAAAIIADVAYTGHRQAERIRYTLTAPRPRPVPAPTGTRESRRTVRQAVQQSLAGLDPNTDRFNTWWATLPETERQDRRTRALAQLARENPTLAAYAERHPHSEAVTVALQRLLQTV